MYDVFISYQHDSKTIADNIVNFLESRKIRCWYAPRDVVGDYATSICNAISNSKIFVLILNGSSSHSNHCLNEVEMAYRANEENNGNIAIMPFRVDNKELNRAMEYYVKRLHWIDATNNSLEDAICNLYEKICAVLGVGFTVTTKRVRFENKYDVSDAKEKRRFLTQLSVSRDFDMVAYEKILKDMQNITVLDVGANNGEVVMDRLGNDSRVEKIIGLEYNEEAVNYANSHFPHKCKFYQIDVEATDFENELIDILNKNGITKVDVINVSMLILHLKNPAKLLKILRKYLAFGGEIIVKDIDDGLNFCYPDPDGKFEKMFEICANDHDAGYRQSGRQVYTLLVNAGFNNIKMENACISTAGFDFDKKQALFDTYFGFIFSDMQKYAKENPENKEIAENCKWLEENFDSLEDQYHVSNFIFNVGFMIFSAEK